MLNNISVLYIEDDLFISEEVVFFLSKKVKVLHVAYNGKEGLELYRKFKPNVIVTDIEMPELNGLDMIAEIKKEDSQTAIIITSAFSETSKLLKAIELGVDAYLVKPINLRTLLEKIDISSKSIFLEKELQKVEELESKERELRVAKEQSQQLLDSQSILLSLFDKGETVLVKWRNDEKWTLEYVSNNIEKLIPGSLARFDLGFEDYISYIHEDDIGRVIQEVKEAIKEGKDAHVHEPYRIKIGKDEIKWVVDNTVSQKDSDGNITHFIGTLRDITEKQNAKKKIEGYLSLIDENIMTTSTDINGIITDVSSAFCEASGYKESDFIGKTYRVLKSKAMTSYIYKDVWKTIIKNKIYTGEFQNIKKDGSIFWVNMKVLPILNESNTKIGYLAIMHDITDKKTIEKISITDDLTKLYNRRYFYECFEKERLRAKRDRKLVVFIMLDVDNFKLYNDTYGHQNGDTALIQIAKALKGFANRGGDYAFRLGGEEFGVILTSDDKEKTKVHVMNLLATIEDLKIVHEKNTTSKYITASLGVVFKEPNSILSVSELYKIADDALYEAKNNGRNKVVFID